MFEQNCGLGMTNLIFFSLAHLIYCLNVEFGGIVFLLDIKI
jgi:hypothetical protein